MGVSKSPLFATETQRIYSKLFFLFRKKFSLEHGLFSFLFAGENSMRGIELVLFFFLFAGENSMRGIEHVLFFFLFAGENSMRV